MTGEAVLQTSDPHKKPTSKNRWPSVQCPLCQNLFQSHVEPCCFGFCVYPGATSVSPTSVCLDVRGGSCGVGSEEDVPWGRSWLPELEIPTTYTTMKDIIVPAGL